MYIEAHIIPSKRDEWIINLHLEDGTKIEAKVAQGFAETLKIVKAWSAEHDNCKYTIGGWEPFKNESKKV